MLIQFTLERIERLGDPADMVTTTPTFINYLFQSLFCSIFVETSNCEFRDIRLALGVYSDEERYALCWREAYHRRFRCVSLETSEICSR